MRSLDNWLRGYINYTWKHQEGPRIFHEWAGLAMLSFALQQHCWLDKGKFKVYPNQYIFLVGSSATRKTTTANTGLNILKMALPESHQVVEQTMTPEVLMKEISENNKEDELLGEISTTLNVYSSEFTASLPSTTQQVDAYIRILTDCYDLKPHFKYRTITRGVDEGFNVLLSLFSATTPEWLKDVIGEREIKGGFASRCLFIYTSKIGDPVPNPELSKTPKLMRLENQLVEDLYEIHNKVVGEYHLDKNATEYWTEWYCREFKTKISSEHNEDILNAFYGRKPIHLLKLAMVIAASKRNERVICLKDLYDANSYVAQIEQSLGQLYKCLCQSKVSVELDIVLKQIRKEKEITRSNLLRKVSHKIGNAHNLQRIINTLEEMDKIEKVISGKSTIYKVKEN